MKKTIKKLLYSQKIAPYVFILPFVLSFLIFFAFPIVKTSIMSFQTLDDNGKAVFIGLKNYQSLLNIHFLKAIRNNIVFTVSTILVMIPIPVLLAILLNNKRLPGRNFFRSALFVPSLISMIVAGVVFRLFFGESQISPVNSFMHLFGIGAIAWQRDTRYAMFLLIVLTAWTAIGINIVYYLAGLQSIPTELYEAADIDGAGYFSKLIYVTIPELRNINIYILTVTIYGGFAMFTQSFIIWDNHSPQDAALTIVGYLYQQGFEQGNINLASAIGIVLVLIVFILNLIQLKGFGAYKEEDA